MNADLPMLETKLKRALRGDVRFDRFTRGRYSTDASIYQIEPLGVVTPRDADDAIRALEIAAAEGVPILPRGAGSSQCGQTVGEALVVDTAAISTAFSSSISKRGGRVEPGIVLDRLNAALKPHGVWFPVDVSTSAQATIGGMAGNNSCGARSLRYGNMVHNVLATEAWLPTARRCASAKCRREPPVRRIEPPRYAELVATIARLYRRERDEIAAKVPNVQRRVAGYNLDMASTARRSTWRTCWSARRARSRGFRSVTLKLSTLPRHKALGVVHFPTFYRAMDCTRHIVELGPDAVELVDRTMIELSREIAAFRATMERTVRGEPEALLLVEFAGEDRAEQLTKLARLGELMADLGLPGSVVEVTESTAQRDVWEVRKAGLNIMMSMKGDGKPVSFIEDCAVPLEHLADYTARLTEVFERHGTRGTFYAHASVGCLHVRPVLNMKAAEGAAAMRSIAEEACALVREYKGSYSGEHGDGLVRSEWIERMYGPRLARAFGEIKQAFDPRGLMNPGKIVAPPRMDDRALFSFKPGYTTAPIETALDWSEHDVDGEHSARGFALAVEMCNNNGHCRKFDAGHDVPVVSRHARRARRHARPREHAAACAVRSARTRRVVVRGDVRDAGAMRLLQGLQARVPDRRRHGAHEDRVPAPLSSAPSAHREGQARRASAALGAVGCPRRAARERAGPPCRVSRACPNPCSVSRPPAACRAGAAISSAVKRRSTPARPRRSASAMSCCSRTHSTRGSSPRTCAPP
jgi:FAD/FMN-containing dehydrogenase